MLVDKKILTGGVAMIAVGIALSAILGEATPIGQGGMTAEEQLEFLMEEQQNTDYKTLAGILIGVGFLLVLISFGARRKKKGGAKKTEKKPATWNTEGCQKMYLFELDCNFKKIVVYKALLTKHWAYGTFFMNPPYCLS